MAWAKWLFPVPPGPRKSASSRLPIKAQVARSNTRLRFIFGLKVKSKLSRVLCGSRKAACLRRRSKSLSLRRVSSSLTRHEIRSIGAMASACAWRSLVPYLEHERCVPAAVLLSPRFAGRMRIDSLGNTVFPHFDAAGLCGYEIKNCGFTGFAAGGQKGLWFSHTQPADRRLILTESAVDALSYAALFPNAEDQTRYASLVGKPSSRQRALVQATIAKLPARAEIVAAFDADDAGRQMVKVIREAAASVARRTGRSDLIFKAHLPTQEGEDWNMVLQNVGLV